MTTAPERRTATLSELVAEEIRALMGRKRMSQAQLARGINKTEMWVSLRLRGKQPIDMNDLHMIAEALAVGVHDLLPPPEVAASAVKKPYAGLIPSGEMIRGRHVAPRAFGPGRRDSSRPASTVRPSTRRPSGGRPADRPRLL